MIWIGTGSGHIGLIDATKQSLVVLTHKYTTPVRSLLYINRKGEIWFIWKKNNVSCEGRDRHYHWYHSEGRDRHYHWYHREGRDRHYHWYHREFYKKSVILVLMYIKTFKTVFIDSVMMCLTSHWVIIFSFTVNLFILKISLREIKGIMYKSQIKTYYCHCIMFKSMEVGDGSYHKWLYNK